MKRLLLLACAVPLIAMDNAVIPATNKSAALSAIRSGKRMDYSVIQDGAMRQVQRCDVYGPLKEISSEKQLSGFLANGGNIRVSKMSNGEYVLRSGVDIKGGGPILALIAYGGVKLLGSSAIAPIISAGITAGVVTATSGDTTTSTARGAVVGTLGGTALVAYTATYAAAVESAAVYAGSCAMAVPFL